MKTKDIQELYKIKLHSMDTILTPIRFRLWYLGGKK